MNKKILLLIILVFGCFFISASSVNALKMGRVTNLNGVNVRYGPGSNYNITTTLSYNDVVPLMSTTLEKATSSCPSGWYKVNYNGLTRYLCSSNVSTSNTTVKVNYSKGVNVRNEPSTKYSVYTKLPNNRIVTLYSTTKYSGTGCSSGWYKISLSGKNRYICSSLTDSYNSNSNLIVSNKDGASIKNSVSGTSLGTLKYNQALTLYSTNKKSDASCSDGYYSVYYKKNIRYVCSNDVFNTTINGSVNNMPGLSVRPSASYNLASVDKLNYGDGIAITNSTKLTGPGCSAGWYEISLNGKKRYVCSSYVTTSNVTTKVTDITSLPFRTGAGTNYDKYNTSITDNTKIYLLSTIKYISSAGCSDGWYKINYNGKSGYVCSTYTDLGKSTAIYKTLTKVNANSSTYYYTTNLWKYKINEDYGYTRTGPSTDYSNKNQLYLGTDLKYLASYKATSGCSAGWYKVAYYNNIKGYICKSLVDSYSSVSKSNTAYCNTLKAKGFPASYCNYLSKLHAIHPNWNFIPEKTGVTFNSAVIGESSKNYTLHSKSAYLASHDYKESGQWRAASDGYIAYMIDPRNYFNEKNIFVFEDLSYDPTYQTNNAVKTIFNGSYLEKDTYSNYFVAVGKTYDISPVHLASRVKQEGGTNEDYSAVSGDVTDKWKISGYVCGAYINTYSGTYNAKTNDAVSLRTGSGTGYSRITVLPSGQTLTLSSKTLYRKGSSGCSSGWYKIKAAGLNNIYNYYNIGAYGDNPVLRGLAAAAGYVDDLDGTPWNTRYEAIKYGAKFIANGYINKGQDTMYYQKFNTGPNSSSPKYTHQYMTNILAPASESWSTYNSYKDLDLMDTKFSFKIPVYSNPPSAHTSHPPVGSYNNYLNDIYVNGKSITGFNKYVTSYNYYVSNKNSTAKVTAKRASSYAFVIGTGTKTINSTTTKVTLRVTSQIGTTKVYTIYLIKVPDYSSLTASQIVDKADVKVNSNYISGFVEGTTGNKLANLFYKVSPNCKVTVTTASGLTRTKRIISGDLVTITNGSSSKKYTLVLKGDIYKDGYINNKDLTKLDKYLSGKITLSNVEKQASDTNYNGEINNTDYLRIQKHINNEIVLK